MDEHEAYIALNMMEGIGPVGVRSLVSRLGSAQAIFKTDKDELLKADGIGLKAADLIMTQREQISLDKELKQVAELNARVIAQVDNDYPQALTHIHDPPLALYVWGTLRPEDRRAIGIVGTRQSTLYGRETAERLAYQLAQTGFTVISGLARGIDTAAHQGALKAKGRTIAVIGSAIDRIYPAENMELARAISEQGAVISEFPMGRDPDKTTFPMRNRIISGLAMGVLVVEAGLQSGALITAHQALDQGRTVFAVPGRVDSAASRGAHYLIKNGARLVETVDDILQEFEFLIPPERKVNNSDSIAVGLPSLSAEERQILDALKDGEMDLDSLTRRTGFKASVISSLAIGLEMKRIVRMLPGRIVELTPYGIAGLQGESES